MKKLLMSAAMAAMFGAMISPAQALTAAGTFDVVINLTSKCEINSTNAATGAVISNLTLNYTSFQTGPSTGTSTFNVKCTNTLPYTMALDLTSVTDGATNLAYTLALSALASPGSLSLVFRLMMSAPDANNSAARRARWNASTPSKSQIVSRTGVSVMDDVA